MSIINVNEIGPISLGSTVTFTPGSTVKVSNLSGNSNTITIPDGQTLVGEGTIRPRYLDIPYAHLIKNSYTVPDGFSNITWDSAASKYISTTSGSANIQFPYAGQYEISVGWRLGTGSDVWTTIRLLDSDSTVRGIGYATGQITNDPGPCMISMFCTIPITRINQNMTIQFYRAGSTMAIGNPAYGYAIVCMIKYIGTL